MVCCLADSSLSRGENGVPRGALFMMSLSENALPLPAIIDQGDDTSN